MDDRDVLILEEYIEHNLPDNPKCFDLYAYSRWAAYEILERVIHETMKLPSHITGVERIPAADIIESFIDEMDYYYERSSSERAKIAFSIARDEGKCILLYICSLHPKGEF